MRSLFITAVFVSIALTGLSQEFDICLSEDELALANSINQFRQENDLEPVSLSKSLSYVADVHTKDLYFNFSPYGACGLYYWSDEGRWDPCCPSGDEEELECIYDKPNELTGYRSKGYEAVFYQNSGVTPEIAYQHFKSDSSAINLALETGRYDGKKWNAMGVSVFEGFVSIWFGELIDEQGEPALCSDMSGNNKGDASAKENQVPGYFVLVRSYSSRKAAENELTKFQKQNYKGRIIPYKSRFRVALGPFKGFSEAQKVKEQLSSDYQDAWIQNVKD